MVISQNFTILAPSIGGALIGLAGFLLLFFNGRIMGCSGILSAVINKSHYSVFSSAILVAGFVIGGILTSLFGFDGFEEIKTDTV